MLAPWKESLDKPAAAAAKLLQLCRTLCNPIYADDTTLIAKSEEELQSLLMRVKENEKAGLKLNIQKMKIMASGPT